MSPTFNKPLRVSPKEERTYKGRVHASKLQMRYAVQLDALVENGLIKWWLREVGIDLGEDFRYRVDFVICDRFDAVWAVDTKGFRTKSTATQAKLWKKYGPFPLHIVGDDRGKGFKTLEIIEAS